MQQRLRSRLGELRKRLEPTDAELRERLADWEARQRARPVKWRPAAVAAAQAESGRELAKRDDGSLAADGAAAKKEAYTIALEPQDRVLRGLRIEVLPPPDGGRRFVLTELQVETAPAESQRRAGRFVRIDLPGDGKFLHLANVGLTILQTLQQQPLTECEMALFLAQQHASLATQANTLFVQAAVQPAQDLLAESFEHNLRGDQAFGQISTRERLLQALLERDHRGRDHALLFRRHQVGRTIEQHAVDAFLLRLHLKEALSAPVVHQLCLPPRAIVRHDFAMGEYGEQSSDLVAL